MLSGWAWGKVVTTIVLMLVAAKTHGRQVRLERERHGIFRVDFRAHNGPIVEGIWRRDRWTFWSTFAAVLVAISWFLWYNPFGTSAPWAYAVGAGLAFASGFIVSGLVSLVMLVRKGHGDPQWLKRVRLGFAGWWGLTTLAVVLVTIDW